MVSNGITFPSLDFSDNQYKPYLYICGVTDDITTLLPVHITKGRMPENDSELLLPEHLAYDGGIAYNLNDEITLDVGERVDEDGFVLDNNTSLLGNKSEKSKDRSRYPDRMSGQKRESVLYNPEHESFQRKVCCKNLPPDRFLVPYL